MKQAYAITVLSLVLLASAHQGMAGEAGIIPVFKSEGVAWALALDPIPGDALFYAGKPIQGTINLLLGLPGGAAFFAGLAMMASMPDHCDDEGDCRGIPAAFVALGGLLYFPMLIWDAAGGISGVQEHNQQIRRQSSFFERFQPAIAVTNNGVFAGAKIHF
ncbi:MAG: hypothetical protein V1495_04130 [Pseudomonadota bacterium]